MNNDYHQFLQGKIQSTQSVGFTISPDQLNPLLFPWQRQIVAWALQKGCAALFEDCGLGKSAQQLEWAACVASHFNQPVLILTPLAVAAQTAREADKFNVTNHVPVLVCESSGDVPEGASICITNYEKLHRFIASEFCGVVLDESSILKSFDGKTRTQLIEMFAQTPCKLACTATPAPNDHMELGNTAEFLGVMSANEMLAQFFVHDGGDTSKWRLKGHAQDEFWKWVCGWGVMIRKPSDLGYSDEGFALPKLDIIEHRVVSFAAVDEGRLFPVEASTLNERRATRRSSLTERAEAAAAQVAIWQAENPIEPVLVFCDFNDEADLMEQLIPGAVQVAGRHTEQFKMEALFNFETGVAPVLITKPSIVGFGMNWQHCAKIVRVGLSDSFEQFYQGNRRCWRFGQTRDVEVHVFISEQEGAVVSNIKRKGEDAEIMAEGMMRHLREVGLQVDVSATTRDVTPYKRQTVKGENWIGHLGDAVEIIPEMESESVGYSIFSPPFSNLYCYSNSERDMGNCRSIEEFKTHFRFLAKELFRVMQSGRLVSMHCFDIPAMKSRDGFIGLFDFPADLREMMEEVGFIYHSKVCIWKDPVTQMQRTKALGLLHKTILKDSSMSRQGMADYLVTMRKPGQNLTPISGPLVDYVGEDKLPGQQEFVSGRRGTPKPADELRTSIEIWQRYASPVWFDINPSRTLQGESAREANDERHICPLQTEVIERGLQLWSAPGDLVLTPFGGIGSEGYVAVKMKRRAVLCELKESYFKQLVLNMKNAEIAASQQTMFDDEEMAA
ncbi:hypothetical protein IAD21_00594 [Abditibacteriota bacterium]|nr:hypothetical protein IAD21_00594 [Abditibacteriota bacterium]